MRNFRPPPPSPFSSSGAVSVTLKCVWWLVGSYAVTEAWMLRAVCARRHFRARHVAAGSLSAGHEAHEQSEREAIGWN